MLRMNSDNDEGSSLVAAEEAYLSRVRTTHPLPTTHPLITQPAGWVLKTKPDPTRSRAGLGILVKPAPTRWVFWVGLGGFLP